MPKVTVLMPVYNNAKYVKEAIDSVLAQTFKDFTLLVMDDCSTDNTAEIVKTFTDRRIRYEKNEHNLGLAENLNRGLEFSETEFCARMDGDDIAEPGWLEKGMAILDRYPEVGICSFGFQFFGAKHSLVRFPEWTEDSKAQMLFGCTVIVPVFRRRVMTDNGFRYLPNAFPAEDYWMWADCYRVTQVYNVQKTFFHYRMHASQISTDKSFAQQQKSDAVRLRMLEWLCPDFSEEERTYFLNVFVPCKMEHEKDIFEIQRFATYLVSKNTMGHFNNEALQRRFRMHLAYGALAFAEKTYFKSNYSLKQYLRFSRSKMFSFTPLKNRWKIFAKSLLHKKK